MIEFKALELIQETAVEAAGVKPVDTACPTVSIPAGIMLKSVEDLDSGRFRFRGKFSTEKLAEFVSYVGNRAHRALIDVSGEQGRGQPQVFVNADAGSAAAFFNLGAPGNAGHGDDKAVLGLEKTAAYSALLSATGTKLTQKSLAEWLEDWAPNIEAVYKSGESGNLAHAIAAVRDLSIKARGESNHQVSDFGASKTAAEEIEASSKGTLPQGFRFVCEPYAGFERRIYDLRLGVITDPEAPRLVLRIVGKEKVDEAIAEEFETRVRDGLTGCDVFRGSFTL